MLAGRRAVVECSGKVVGDDQVLDGIQARP
jgi:hypothetical protein